MHPVAQQKSGHRRPLLIAQLAPCDERNARRIETLDLGR